MNRDDVRIPYYVQIADTLRRRIMTGEYIEGSLIPIEAELGKEFNVSNITIRKALETLTKDGLLRFVRSIENLPVEIEVLEMKVIPCPNYVQQMLSLAPDAKVLRIKKVRKHGGKPLSFYLHYTDPALYKQITRKKAEKKTFVDLFEEVTKTKLTTLKQKIESVVADIDLSNMLQVRFGLPLFFTENLYMTDGQKPAILTQIYYRGDKCFYKTSTKL